MNQREFFDSKAHTWDDNRDPEQIKRIDRLIEAINLIDNEFIIDIGSGTGILLPYFKNISYIAIDISFNMLKKAQDKYKGKNTFVQADACTLPFKQATFDRAVLFAVFPHIENKLKALIQVCHVLKPGGKINILHAASRQTINDFHREQGGTIEHDSIPDQKGMLELLAKSGFKEIQILDLPDRYLANAIKL